MFQLKPKSLVLALCFILLYNLDEVYSAKILVVSFVATKSHKIAYMPLIRELGKRGHDVTEFSPIGPFSPPSKNVKEILTVDVEKMSANFFGNPYKIKEENKQYNPMLNTEWFTKVCSETYDLPQIKALMNETFDLIIMQPLVNDCALGFVYRMGVPFILFIPVGIPGFFAERIGNHFPLSFVPNVLSGLPADMTFSQRLKNAAYDILIRATMIFKYEPAVQEVYRQKLGYDIPSIPEILANASLALTNSHFSVHDHRPLLPDIVEVGGLNARPPVPLPKEIEKFIQKGKHGFIYFSMGSALKGSMMPDSKRMLFMKVFSKLKQQVIWKWETETMQDTTIPPNVLLKKWLPQQDLLGHKAIKMFITHCGGGSVDESIYHGVPLIGLPMFADQPNNAKLAQRLGFIISLDWNSLTEEKITAAFEEILTNSTYRENAKRISTVFRDRPIDPMEHAVYNVEYVLRHKGAPHLRSQGRKLNYFQYHSYDVMLVYFLGLSLILYLIFFLVRFFFQTLCGLKKIKKD